MFSMLNVSQRARAITAGGKWNVNTCFLDFILSLFAPDSVWYTLCGVCLLSNMFRTEFLSGIYSCLTSVGPGCRLRDEPFAFRGLQEFAMSRRQCNFFNPISFPKHEIEKKIDWREKKPFYHNIINTFCYHKGGGHSRHAPPAPLLLRASTCFDAKCFLL